MRLFGRIPDVTAENALPGSPEPRYHVPATHEVLGTPLHGPWPDGTEVLYVAMGCFWGVERIYWNLPGVVTTAAGYMGGYTQNPTYEETCTGMTGHTETVLVAYDPAQTTPQQLLKAFWENHDPTTPNQQGNDVGTQYRSAVYWTTDAQREAVEQTRDLIASELAERNLPPISTEFKPAAEAGEFFYAEDYHQQYLHKVPNGYCNHGPNGLSCNI